MSAVDIHVVGGGLAGCEAAWQLAEAGLRVALIEMKPGLFSPAHQTPFLAELVCSNTFRSDDPTTGPGLLKDELRRAGSLIMACADAHRVPAGGALGVERVGFARAVTTRLALHSRVRIERRRLDELPDGPVILATGPLTGGAIGKQIQNALGGDRLYFYDAIAPIVDATSIDFKVAFRQSRWDKDTPGASSEQGDYVNCPMNEGEYTAFVHAINAGRKVLPHSFEQPKFFEGCLPIEVMASRGDQVLAHGPMRPIGLQDPRTGRRPHAVVQLRPENEFRTSYNIVGFQTRLAYPEQDKIFRMIPGLADAEFLRFGSIHRNSFVDSPNLLSRDLSSKTRPDLWFAGLLTGVEGYIESCGMGFLAGLFAVARLTNGYLSAPPVTTALGGLYHHVCGAKEPGQAYIPTNINFGLLPPLPGKQRKVFRRFLLTERAQNDFGPWLDQALPNHPPVEPRRPERPPAPLRRRKNKAGAATSAVSGTTPPDAATATVAVVSGTTPPDAATATVAASTPPHVVPPVG